MNTRPQKNLDDIESLLSCLHDHGRFQFMGGPLCQRKYWRIGRLAHGKDSNPENLRITPINHEQITGDFFPSGRLLNPRIPISNNVAGIVVTYTNGSWWWQKHFITAIKTARNWKILKLDWEQI